jgi:hypothetical protein
MTVRMYVRHHVTDFAAWRKVYDAFDAKSYAALSRKSESVRLPLSVPGAVSVPRLAGKDEI